MIEIKTNQREQINFDISISGIDVDVLKARFVLHLDSITNLAFQAQEITSNNINVIIPPIDTIIQSYYLENLRVVDAELEVYADNVYLSVWQDEVTFVHSLPKIKEIKNRVNKLRTNDKKLKQEIKKLKKAIAIFGRVILEQKKKLNENQNQPAVQEKIERVNHEEKKNMTLDEYFTRNSIHNQKIKQVLKEKAIARAGTDEPKEVIKALREMLKVK